MNMCVSVGVVGLGERERVGVGGEERRNVGSKLGGCEY